MENFSKPLNDAELYVLSWLIRKGVYDSKEASAVRKETGKAEASPLVYCTAPKDCRQ